MTRIFRRIAFSLAIIFSPVTFADNLADSVQADYDDHLGYLFEHFHRNPELSTVEFETAARMAEELKAAGFEVTVDWGDGVVDTYAAGEPSPINTAYLVVNYFVRLQRRRIWLLVFVFFGFFIFGRTRFSRTSFVLSIRLFFFGWGFGRFWLVGNGSQCHHSIGIQDPKFFPVTVQVTDR